MAPSERATLMIREAEGGCVMAQTQLGFWHRGGDEGLEQDDVKAAAWFLKAADLGDARAQRYLAGCYYLGDIVEKSYALAAVVVAQGGRPRRRSGSVSSGQVVRVWGGGRQEGLASGEDVPGAQRRAGNLRPRESGRCRAELLKELRRCACCGTLDVHHMICAWCRNVRYCDATCQLRHWQRAADPHKPHCGRRREAAGAGGSSSSSSSSSSDPSDIADSETEAPAAMAKMEAAKAAVATAAAAAAAEAQEDVFASAAAVDEAIEAVEAAVTAATAARAAVLAAKVAPAAGKKERGRKAAKVKAAETAAETAAHTAAATQHAAQEAANEARAAFQAAQVGRCRSTVVKPDRVCAKAWCILYTRKRLPLSQNPC